MKTTKTGMLAFVAVLLATFALAGACNKNKSGGSGTTPTAGTPAGADAGPGGGAPEDPPGGDEPSGGGGGW
jgi:hypothetical protein